MGGGMTVTPQTINSIIADPDNAIKILVALKDGRSKVTELERKLNNQVLQIECANNILFSENTYTTIYFGKDIYDLGE